MWIFQNDSFLSIVQHKQLPDSLLVRSRVDGDIERVFPNVEVFQIEEADYRYRAVIPREELKRALSDAVDRIDYPNFKDSIHKSDAKRKRAYMSVWSALAQAYGAYGRIP